jgi:hypothetical protein
MTNAEAMRWKRRAITAEKLIEKQRSSWGEEWPDGIGLDSIDLRGDDAEISAMIRAARRLKHAVVCAEIGRNHIVFFAIPLAETTKD